VYPVSSTHIRNAIYLPDHVRFGFICIALSHRYNQSGHDPQLNHLCETYYQYRGRAIRSLSEDIDVEHKRLSNELMAGVMIFLLTDVGVRTRGIIRQLAQIGIPGPTRRLAHLAISPGRSPEADAAARWNPVIESVRESGIDASLFCVVSSCGNDLARQGAMWLTTRSVAVMANTTTPSPELITASSHVKELDLMLDQYGHNIFAFQLCPRCLLGEIIRINHLRMMSASGINDAQDHASEALEILGRIEDFSSSTWAAPKPSSTEVWFLVGNIYQTAVILYCISSLQSVSIIPHNTTFRNRCAAHGKSLHMLLAEGLRHASVKRFLLWPLVVLGVEAIHGGQSMRCFVRKQLPELSRFAGVYAPIAAMRVLERFWASGKTGWDACFDRPYAFSMHPAIDISRIQTSHQI
jgi:hypothetical protein